MFPSRLPIDNNQETVPLSPRPFIKTGLAAEESDSSIYIRGANMKRYRLFQNIGLLTAMSFALVSCFKDELVGSRVNSRSNIIGFGISAATTADGAPLTRATQYADSALLMLGRGGADTLYLHASSENNISALDTSVATRGVPVNSSNFSTVCKNFSVSAFTPTGAPYMKNVRVDNLANGIWSSDEEHFWPEEGDMALDFFACAPSEYTYGPEGSAVTVPVLAQDDIAFTTKDSKKLEFDYTVPGSESDVTNAAERQPDIMFAYSACSRDESSAGSVPLKFYHALAGVKFVTKDISAGTVKSITLKNLYGAGKCTYVFPEPTITWNFDGQQQNASFLQEFNVKVNNQQTGEQDITDKAPETTFMMLPQNIEKAEVEVLFNDGETDYTLTGKLFDPSITSADNDTDLSTWDPGKIYTYAISTESINWTYVFKVTPTITLKLGETSAPYKVTSYRFRTSNRDEKQPVAWTAKARSAIETDPSDNSVKDILSDLDTVVTEFDYSGYGSEAGAVDHNFVMEAGVLHTTYKHDAEMQSYPPKGSLEKPYDLSTSGCTIPRETANCYAVNASGTYMLPLVYGNAIKNGQDNTRAYSNPDFKDYLGNSIEDPYIYNNHGYQPYDACLVWSDGYYMFENVHLSDDKKWLVFSINADYMQQANAVLAVRDSQGRIMWSWHIWVTERTLQTVHQVQDYDSGQSNAYGLMQCNLGWVDAKWVYYNSRNLDFDFTQNTSGNVQSLKVIQEGAAFDYKDVGSTYYQWGRKDPLVALQNWDTYGYKDYRLHQTSDTKYVYRHSNGQNTTIGGAIQHPNVYFTRSTDINPETGKPYAANWLRHNVPTLWNADQGNQSSTNSVKTIYDPSPRGYKVPVPRAFAVFVDGCTGDGSKPELRGTLNGEQSSEAPFNTYYVWTGKDGTGEHIPMTGTGQRADVANLPVYKEGDNLAEIGGLWSLYGVYYWSCIQNNETSGYTLVIRCDRDRATNEIVGNITYSYLFSGTKTMARPVRCIEDRD